jgi:tRNA threonylcarbamoyl adenosine modification protein (Sua5/YciO/YrdC/YwlC family)
MVEAGEVAAAVAAVRAGQPVLLPADGVYGLCASAFKEAPVRRLYDLKGRGSAQPTAMIASSVDMLLECVPELRGRAADIRALLPGPYTLVLPNPARRYPWLNGESPETIGVRVVELPRTAQYVLDAVGAVAATSANDPGEPPAASLGDVPQRIRDGCGAEVDAGTLSGEPSTVLDLTGEEPRVLRAGAGSVDEALAKLG